MKQRFLLLVMCVGWAAAVAAADRSWENPVFATAEEAVSQARILAPGLDAERPVAQGLFVDLVLAEGDLAGSHPSSEITRQVVENILLTHPRAFSHNTVQRRTIERFTREMPRQQKVVQRRLARFSFPQLSGLVYCRLVDSVDAFAGLNQTSSDKMSRVGGVTYYCRYVVLPLSYVGEQSLRELRYSAARNPSLDVDATVRTWQRESYASLVNTFRHELVHVHTNSLLDVPLYSNRRLYPTWFHEGTATYMAGDPHSGLSEDYQEFQELFFYLVQRHGVARLQDFYSTIFAGSGVNSALAEVYAIPNGRQLFASSSRWHAAKGAARTGVWVLGLALVIAAFRGADLPYIGGLQLLVASALALALATGLAEHLFGLGGVAAVLAAKGLFTLVVAVVGLMGVRRLWRHRKMQSA